MSQHRYRLGTRDVIERYDALLCELRLLVLRDSTGSENMSRRCIIFGILRQRRGLIRTGTASPSCSQARPGAQPWLCSWGEARISTPGRRNRTVLALFHWAKMMASKFREVLFSTWTVRTKDFTWMSVAGAGQWAWIISFDTNPTPPSQISGGCTWKQWILSTVGRRWEKHMISTYDKWLGKVLILRTEINLIQDIVDLETIGIVFGHTVQFFLDETER